MKIVGVDGCRGRWLAVAMDNDTSSIAASIHATPDALLQDYPDAAAIALDMPIGLTCKDPRECDIAARRLLGWPRSSSVFPAPIRPALSALSREEADRITREQDGRGVGCQAWNIYKHVLAWDTLLRRDDGARKQVFEVHPEVSFYAMNGQKPLLQRKKSPEGKKWRRQLLDKSFGRTRVSAALADLDGERFGMDDFHDALVALWSAYRIVRKKACCLPEQPPIDTYGLKMGIWY